MIELPKYLQSTYEMLSKAFHNSLNEDEYRAVLKILYEHMSDRNLAKVISIFTNKDYSIVLNDIYLVLSNKNIKKNILNDVQEKLNLAGFNYWIKDE